MDMLSLNERVEIGNHGFLVLEGIGGSDLTIVNAARTSFDSHGTWHNPNCYATREGDNDCDCEYWDERECDVPTPRVLSYRDKKVLAFLLKNRHGSPFEQVEVWIRARAPIFVIREWVRHRIAEINEQSGRYDVLPDEWWLPEPDAVRTQVGKPGHYTFEPMGSQDAEYVIDLLNASCQFSFDIYNKLLAKGVAKEVARTCLPVSTYSTFVWKSNLRALFNFLNLRNDEHAQREIREYAAHLEAMVEPHLPVAFQAFVDNGRVAP